MDPGIADPQEAIRHPTLTAAGRAMLRRLTGHEAAPRFTGASGSRLTPGDLDAWTRFDRETLHAPFDWRPGVPPPWMEHHVARVYARTPHYRPLGSAPARLSDVEPVSRADFSADIAAFVCDNAPIDRLITYQTSGTTGHPLATPSHPLVAARYQTFHKRALGRFGVTPRAGAGEVGVVLLGMQRRCFTYVSVTPTLNEAGLAKINLHPDAWRDPTDRARYLDALTPELLAGDPISFAALLDLPVSLRPRALLSVSMMLTGGLRTRLETRFGCPVLDLYSMNEVGPIGVWDARAGGHVLLQPGLYVEIVGSDGRALPVGQRGEICVSGGFNVCLPLLRYRTGDHAALGEYDGEPVLIGLAGREPVRVRTAGGGWVNNVDVSHGLESLSVAQFALHQTATGTLILRLPSRAMEQADLAISLLRAVLGELAITVVALQTDDKVLQYTSELTPP